MTYEMEGWGPIPEEDPAPPAALEADREALANGDLDGIVGALDPVALVQAISASPEALEALAGALAPKQEKDPLYVFGSLDEFVEEYVLANWRHRMEGDRFRWCEWWYLHTQAAVELDMMWHSWEAHRRVPSSLAQWNIHTFWPIWDRLLHPDTSPFDGCTHSGGGKVAEHAPSQRRLPVQLADGVFPKYPTKANPDQGK